MLRRKIMESIISGKYYEGNKQGDVMDSGHLRMRGEGREERPLCEYMKGGLAKQARLYSAWEMGFGLIMQFFPVRLNQA